MTIKKFLLLALPAVTLLTACERTYELIDENNTWEYVDTTNKAFIKFVHAYAPTTPALTSGAGPTFQVYSNNQRLSGGAVAYNGTYPAPSGAYTVVPSGTHNIMFILNRVTGGNFAPVAGDTVYQGTANLSAGQKYTAFFADSVQSPGVFLVEDDWTISPQGYYKVRFANLIANPNERYDVYADSVQKMVATNIGYREISNFIDVPVPVSSESFSVFLAGTTTKLYTLTGFSPTSQRVYTLYTRGRAGISTRAPGITFYTNR